MVIVGVVTVDVVVFVVVVALHYRRLLVAIGALVEDLGIRV